MTPPRFIECLAYLFWSLDDLAEILECEDGLVHAWAAGQEEIPPNLAAWLETLAKCHEAAGVPTTWKRKKFRTLP